MAMLVITRGYHALPHSEPGPRQHPGESRGP